MILSFLVISFLQPLTEQCPAFSWCCHSGSCQPAGNEGCKVIYTESNRPFPSWHMLAFSMQDLWLLAQKLPEVTPKSAPIILHYFACSCVTIAVLSWQWGILRNSLAPPSTPPAPRSAQALHWRSFGITGRISLLHIHTHGLGSHPHSKGISPPLILHRGQIQK